MSTLHSYLPAAARPATPKPLYAQVRELLLGRIRSGEWGPGETLPNEYTLSTEFEVSIGTVRRAVADLEENGVLVRKQGRGTFVAGRGATALQEKFSGLRDLSGGRLDRHSNCCSSRAACPLRGRLTSCPQSRAGT